MLKARFVVSKYKCEGDTIAGEIF